MWSIVKAAVTRVPWSKVVQHAPAVVDALGRVKTRVRLQEAAQKDADDQLRLLVEENARLHGELNRLSKELQRLNSRVALFAKLAGVALVCAAAALVLALTR
jgi:hypothetical protein